MECVQWPKEKFDEYTLECAQIPYGDDFFEAYHHMLICRSSGIRGPEMSRGGAAFLSGACADACCG
eukprot:1184624-Amphidinium_carterae.1